MKKIVLIAALLMAFGCSKLDVVGTDSTRAFGEMVSAAGGAKNRFGEAELNGGFGGFTIAAPDQTALFFWGDGAGVRLSLAPFLEAGLDEDKLPIWIKSDGQKLTITAKLGEASTTAIGAYESIVKTNRAAVGYHAALDHYGVNLGNGNLFEWAKDLAKNDKDMVFVLDPTPFIAAGVDVNAVSGWIFAKVTIDDENGKPIEVDKLLKPFNLR
ncbi:hypothetical protein AGMMS50229_17260 [Campylobacterota bacterium]|nr:hypothetical protein AGMMS50229_17260 [Campylobacterota bacterium]